MNTGDKLRFIGPNGAEFIVTVGPAFTAETIADFVERGEWTPADSTPSDTAPPGDGDAAVTEPQPAEDAPKTAWVEYAVRVHGARFGEAKSLTRDELIARYGQPAGLGESAG